MSLSQLRATRVDVKLGWSLRGHRRHGRFHWSNLGRFLFRVILVVIQFRIWDICGHFGRHRRWGPAKDDSTIQLNMRFLCRNIHSRFMKFEFCHCSYSGRVLIEHWSHCSTMNQRDTTYMVSSSKTTSGTVFSVGGGGGGAVTTAGAGRISDLRG